MFFKTWPTSLCFCPIQTIPRDLHHTFNSIQFPLPKWESEIHTHNFISSVTSSFPVPVKKKKKKFKKLLCFFLVRLIHPNSWGPPLIQRSTFPHPFSSPRRKTKSLPFVADYKVHIPRFNSFASFQTRRRRWVSPNLRCGNLVRRRGFNTEREREREVENLRERERGEKLRIWEREREWKK